MPDKKTFYKQLLLIALPVAMQNLITSSINLIDTMMVGQIGVEALAAVGSANQLFFFYSLIIFGVCSGAGIFIAQYWGDRDVRQIRAVMGFVLIVAACTGLFFSLVAYFLPGYVMDLFSAPPDVRKLGIHYLRLISPTYLISSVSSVYSLSSRAVQKPLMPMLVSSMALLINASLNILLIFGFTPGVSGRLPHFFTDALTRLGVGVIPAMGVNGAALATLIARSFEAVLMIIIIYLSRHVLAGTLQELLSFDRRFIKRYIATALPVVINESVWALGVVMYSVAYASLGKNSIAAVQVSNTVSNIFMIFLFGVANACAAMIGEKIGARHKEAAFIYARKFSILSALIGVAIGAVMLLNLESINGWFQVPLALRGDVDRLLTVKSLMLPLGAFNTTLIIGILRSGGDTRTALLLDMGGVWLVGVPMAFIGVFLFHWPIWLVAAFVSLEELFKISFGLPRLLSRRWLRDLVHSN